MKAVADADAETATKECTRVFTKNGVKHPLIERNLGTVQLIFDGHQTWINVNK